jgi:hypothetical protein
MAKRDTGGETAAIARRIKARMEELEIDNPGLAQELQVTADTIYRLRRGETFRRWLNLIRLSRALRTTPNELLGFDGADTAKRLRPLLVAAFRGLGEKISDAEAYAKIFLGNLHKHPDPEESVPESDVLRIEIASAKRQSAVRGP